MKFNIIFIFLTIVSNFVTAEEQPNCHIYIESGGGLTVNSELKKSTKARYDSSELCSTTLKNFVCYSYFEEKDKCSIKDDSLYKLFLKDAKADGKIIL